MNNVEGKKWRGEMKTRDRSQHNRPGDIYAGFLLPVMILMALLFTTLMAFHAPADTALFPHITEAMTDPDFWADRFDEPDAILADEGEISAMNAAFLADPDCCMFNLLRPRKTYDGKALTQELVKKASQDLSIYLGDGYYGEDGEHISYKEMVPIIENIDGGRGSSQQEVRYGICVNPTDVRILPTEMIITDDPGDNDFDVLQDSGLRVNEPVIIRAQTHDKKWFYCDTICVSGWVPAEDVAICAHRGEWMRAWHFPESEALVITEGRLYLDESNVNDAASRRMLTMGTVLQRVSEEEYDPVITNRAPFHNYAVYLPVRNKKGKYETTIALIPVHSSVSEGYLPLTVRNVLTVAFSMLGDAYGWGGMLGVPDCSLYARNIYKCFGLELPRNRSWQAAMPAFSKNLSEMRADQKKAALNEMPPGTILYFKGHIMLYLGRILGRHYVISSVSSMLDTDGDGKLRVRGVVLNTLEDTKRVSGNTWLQDLARAIVPWLPEGSE